MGHGMQRHNARTASPISPRRGLAVLIATGAALGSTLLATAPAYANATTKQVSADGTSVTFTTSDSSRDVSGSVTFVVREDGNWSISGSAHNSNLVGRSYHWICDLTWDASSISNSTGTEWVPGKKDRSTGSAAYDPIIQSNYAVIVERGEADCDIVIG